MLVGETDDLSNYMRTKILSTYVLGIALSLVFTVNRVVAQDFHFTQYDKSQLTLNPALTGSFYGDWRLYNMYRSQWGGVLEEPFTTIGLGFQKPIYLENDKIAIGLFALNDQVGDMGYQTNYVSLSASYHKIVGLSEISFGLQGAYTIRSIADDIAFPEDFDRVTGTFVPDASDMEVLNNTTSSHLDINLGVAWRGNFDNFKPSVGIAGYHINKPKEVFFANSPSIETRIVSHLSFKTFVADKFYVDPNFMLNNKAKVTSSIVGVNLGMELGPNSASVEDIYAGLLIRNGVKGNQDAFILRAGTTFSNFIIGASYDFNISELKQGVASNGSFEFTLSYTAASTRLIKTKIDYERL